MFDHDFHFGFEYLSEEETLEGPLRLTALGVETEWYPDKVTKHNERPIYTYTFLYTIQGSGIVEDEKGIKHVCGKNHAALSLNRRRQNGIRSLEQKKNGGTAGLCLLLRNRLRNIAIKYLKRQE